MRFVKVQNKRKREVERKAWEIEAMAYSRARAHGPYSLPPFSFEARKTNNKQRRFTTFREIVENGDSIL
jgi:hypothetical protein